MAGELSLACIGEKRVVHNLAKPDHTIRCVRSCNVEQQTDDHLSLPAFWVSTIPGHSVLAECDTDDLADLLVFRVTVRTESPVSNPCPSVLRAAPETRVEPFTPAAAKSL